ncbi:DUF6252 family protein [Paracrocinitomix mangrovi]|uniref:DUF6252 family protein n=1 Tax=Paracrocinitomix mangrovi TaxID=2862509 RepID=UPI001C8E7F46|nr:DUF6252 family protein [Paracrocinitomix mangrovi]UKN00235.1 DUF6252 family protein [Paracrocinitomix mangrovi]
MSLIACKKDKQTTEVVKQLPEATQIGANTFGCKINGEVFLPKGNIYYWGIDYPKYYTSSGRLWIRIRNISDYENWIYMHIHVSEGIFNTGSHNLSLDDSYAPYKELIEDAPDYEYIIDTTSNYQVNITRIDTEENIVSGQFEFTCLYPPTSDTIKVTEGRFDLNSLIVQE